MPTKLVYKSSHFKLASVDEKNYIIEGIFSTATEDRQGEIVDQNGWKLDDFMANPVILFAHDHYQPAVAKAIRLEKDGNGNLVGAIQFAAEEYDFAATLFKLYAGGYMRAFSVGFMNNKYEIDQENDVVILKENTLYEISCVNVPANAMALANQKGIDVTPVERFMTERAARHGEQKTVTDVTPEAPKDEVKPDDEHEDVLHVEIAVDAVSQTNVNTIKTAIATLTKVIEAAGAQARAGEVEHPAKAGGANKVSVALLNKAVRELLHIKKLNQ